MKKVIRRTATYQVGVDILGFPLYVEHVIYQDNPVYTRNGGKKWLSVITNFFKQH